MLLAVLGPNVVLASAAAFVLGLVGVGWKIYQATAADPQAPPHLGRGFFVSFLLANVPGSFASS